MTKKSTCAVAWILCAVLVLAVQPQVACGEFVFAYTGQEFDDLSGDDFTVDDSVTGQVTFSSQPTAGSSFTGTEILSYSFSAGPVTIAADGELPDTDIFLFSFDDEGRIEQWIVFLSDTLGNSIRTSSPLEIDFGVKGSSYGRIFNQAGNWAAVVPEPGTLAMWLVLAIACGAITWWRGPGMPPALPQAGNGA